MQSISMTVSICFQVDLNKVKAIHPLKNRGQSGSVNYPSWRGQTETCIVLLKDLPFKIQCVVWAGNVVTPEKNL